METRYPWRLQAPIYGVGFFATAIYYTSMVLVPLQAVALGASPAMLGLVFAARHFLPLLLSIHAGALMDRVGVRRVMIGVALLGAMVPLFYPGASWLWVLILCQLFAGLTDILGWMGAQTLIGHHLGSRTGYAGRLTAIAKGGPLLGPLVAGASWDQLGPWGGFGVLSLLALGMLVSALALPRREADIAAPAPAARAGRLAAARTLLPRPADYVSAFRLVGQPAIAMVTLLGAVYHLVAAIQGTFYLSWLTGMGLGATEIGGLVSLGAAAGAGGALLTGRLCRYVPGPWLLLLASWAAVVFVCLTPMIAGLTMLGVFMALRMGALGVSQPLTVSLLLGAVGPGERGLAIGLRGTLNRVASIAAPVLMGLIAELFGVEAAFYVIGGAMSLGFAAMILYFRRHRDTLPPLWRRRAAPDAAAAPPLVRFGPASLPRAS